MGNETEKRSHTDWADKVHFQIGAMYVEMNTIIRRINRRKYGEPTTKERARLEELRREIAAAKRGQGCSES